MKKLLYVVIMVAGSWGLVAAQTQAAPSTWCQGAENDDNCASDCGLDCKGKGSYADGDYCYCND